MSKTVKKAGRPKIFHLKRKMFLIPLSAKQHARFKIALNRSYRVAKRGKKTSSMNSLIFDILDETFNLSDTQMELFHD